MLFVCVYIYIYSFFSFIFFWGPSQPEQFDPVKVESVGVEQVRLTRSSQPINKPKERKKKDETNQIGEKH